MEYPCYIDSAFPRAADLLSRALCSVYATPRKPPVLLCIGTDRATGDSLGPLVGHLLKQKKVCKDGGIALYGDLEQPIHAKNITEELEVIRRIHENPLIVAIDASLGKSAQIGFLKVGKGPISPGAAAKRPLPPVGDLHITGIVNFGGAMELMVLQNTRLNIVMKMASVISEGLDLWLKSSY